MGARGDPARKGQPATCGVKVFAMCAYRVEANGAITSSFCDCCGTVTRRFSGIVHADDATLAAYSVVWTAAHQDRLAYVDLVLGQWGEPASNADRFAVLLECNLGDGNLPVRVIDAVPDRTKALASRHLRREEVIGQPLAQEVFAIIDAIWLQDPHIEELRHMI